MEYPYTVPLGETVENLSADQGKGERASGVVRFIKKLWAACSAKQMAKKGVKTRQEKSHFFNMHFFLPFFFVFPPGPECALLSPPDWSPA